MYCNMNKICKQKAGKGMFVKSSVTWGIVHFSLFRCSFFNVFIVTHLAVQKQPNAQGNRSFSDMPRRTVNFNNGVIRNIYTLCKFEISRKKPVFGNTGYFASQRFFFYTNSLRKLVIRRFFLFLPINFVVIVRCLRQILTSQYLWIVVLRATHSQVIHTQHARIKLLTV